MKPTVLRVMERMCLFVWKSLRSSDKLLKAVFNAIRNDANDGWNKSVSGYMGVIGAQFFTGRKAQLKREMLDHAVESVLALKREHSSLYAMFQPTRWFKLPAYMNDSQAVGVLN